MSETKRYVFVDPNDPTKFKIESRSKKPKDALAETDLDYSDAKYIISVIDGVVTLDEARKADTEAGNVTNASIDLLFETMTEEVANDMLATFHTEKSDCALTDYLTLIDMQAFPDAYKDMGIKVIYTLKDADGVTIFGPGDLLNTDKKILGFAARQIELIRGFSIRRLQKIDKFNDDKNAILGV